MYKEAQAAPLTRQLEALEPSAAVTHILSAKYVPSLKQEISAAFIGGKGVLGILKI